MIPRCKCGSTEFREGISVIIERSFYIDEETGEVLRSVDGLWAPEQGDVVYFVCDRCGDEISLDSELGQQLLALCDR